MNNKGFSLVELLAVIAILAIVIGLSVPVISTVRNSISENMLEKKYSMIEDAAIIYGEDHENEINNSSKKYDGNNCIVIKVNNLVPRYLDSETGTNCGTECIKNEVTGGFLDDTEVIIYSKSKRINAIIKNNEECK